MSAGLPDDVAEGVHTALADMKCGRDGVATLVRLLQTADAGTMQNLSAAGGLAALLDGVRTRLDLACDGLCGAAMQLGMEVAL